MAGIEERLCVLDIFDHFSVLVLPASVYVSLRFYGAHLPPVSLEALSRWLKGSSSDSWIALYLGAFDHVFGPRAFSLKRLWRTALASVASVVLLWFAFGALHALSPERLAPAPGFLGTVGLALILNLIPDILSFQQTRLLLGAFAHARNPFVQAAVLLADFLASAAIILSALALWRLVTGKGLVLPLEVIGGFTPYSLFFYSSFLTSVWAWLFVASLWIMRLSAALWRGRFLDVAGKPMEAFALLVAAFTLLGALVAPRAAPLAARAENLLCDHLLPNCGAAYEARAVAALRGFCVGESRVACYRRITGYFARIERPDLADKLILNGCAQGKTLYCQIASLVPGQTRERRRMFLQEAGLLCAEGDEGCDSDKSWERLLDVFVVFGDDHWPRQSVYCPLDLSWGAAFDDLAPIEAAFDEAERMLARDRDRLDAAMTTLEQEELRLKVIEIQLAVARPSVASPGAEPDADIDALMSDFWLSDDDRAEFTGPSGRPADPPGVSTGTATPLAKLRAELALSETRLRNAVARNANARARNANARARGANIRADNAALQCQLEAKVRQLIYGPVPPPGDDPPDDSTPPLRR